MDTINKDLYFIIKKLDLINERAIFKDKLIMIKNDIVDICECFTNVHYYYLKDFKNWQKFDSLIHLEAFEKILNCLHNEFTFHCITNLHKIDPALTRNDLFSQVAKIISKIEKYTIKINYFDFVLNISEPTCINCNY